MRDLKFDNKIITPDWIRDKTVELIQRYPHKINWFLERGYSPHFYQLWFHTAQNDVGLLARWRSLVAGRRGGKTMSAAWEMAYYMANPEQWWIDVHGETSKEKPWWWFLGANHNIGTPALLMFRDVMRESGLVPNRDYKENRNEKYFEFRAGGRIDFRSAEHPTSLVGAGLNGIWVDEAAKIPTEEAWLIVRPTLSDKRGIGIFTTTPEGKNWFYNHFHGPNVYDDPNIARVEYRSIDNTYFRTEEWEDQLKKYPPLAFKREYMASFDAFAGRDLQGDWLHYYTWDDLPLVNEQKGHYNLDYYIGVDPAISIATGADHFAMAVIGVTKPYGNQAYLIDIIKVHKKFAEQLDLINDYNIKWQPQLISIEQTAYQQALVQQAERLESFPNIQGIKAYGKKVERIISMSPAFRVGKVLVREDQKAFIDEWLDYDTENKNANDDALDAVEIALRSAGILTEQPVRVLTKEPSADPIQDWIHSKQFKSPPSIEDEYDPESEQDDYWPADYTIIDGEMGAEW